MSIATLNTPINAVTARKQRATQTIAQMQREAAKAFANASEQEKQNLISEAIGWADQWDRPKLQTPRCR